MIDLIRREMDISKYMVETMIASMEKRTNDGWMGYEVRLSGF
jgi:hypothetical protein